MKTYCSNYIEEFIEKTGLDIDEVAELYKIFIEELTSEVKELKTFINEADYKKAITTVHNIKGISSNFLALKVYSIAKEFDLQLKAGLTDNIDIMLYNLISEVTNIKASIISIFKSKGISLEG